MSVESTHEQSLVTEASVVFFPMNMLKSVLLFLVMLGYGEMDLSLDCNDPHTMMVRVK